MEYYYLWKKTPGANNNRPHRRRRQGSLRRIRTTRATRPSSAQKDEASNFQFFFNILNITYFIQSLALFFIILKTDLNNIFFLLFLFNQA